MGIKVVRRVIGKVQVHTEEGLQELDVYYPSPAAMAALESLQPIFDKLQKREPLTIEELESLKTLGNYIARDVLRAEDVDIEGDFLLDLILALDEAMAPLAQKAKKVTKQAAKTAKRSD